MPKQNKGPVKKPEPKPNTYPDASFYPDQWHKLNKKKKKKK